ncbi:succinate dehydrogenase assembly factor 2, mitochondrial [Plakobranchus ocellatus]|uniref:Succinate dehydrogenase assembly factor 2, mitochondrial n=1 Tax=Plakobranchus ocellatus TaxID=259542 RepID=A0AAV3XUR5_9GAST|nr:succinate dehydrogenase assembly factor 2, mitochondrial [Plakobranchus ocellatus]
MANFQRSLRALSRLIVSQQSHPQLNRLSALRLLSTGESSDGIVDPPDLTPPIPPYTEKTGESIDLKRARLLYQSRKRGMLENGLLLSTFASKYLDSFSEDQLSSYDKLINQPTNDWEIYYWVTGAKETPQEYKSDVMELLQKFSKNEEKSSRIRQPDL